MKFKMFAASLLAAVLVVPASADDAVKEKKGKRGGASPAMQIMKQLEAVELTDAQKEKIKELGKEAAAAMKTITEENHLTPELMKKRQEATKSLKDSGKKGKEMSEAVNEAAGFTDEQAAAFEKLNTARQAFQKSVVGILTDAQKENLPQAMKRLAGQGGKGKGKGKKKNAA